MNMIVVYNILLVQYSCTILLNTSDHLRQVERSKVLKPSPGTIQLAYASFDMTRLIAGQVHCRNNVLNK
jgi:hypothetical protein